MPTSTLPTPDPVRQARSHLANTIRRGDDPADAYRRLNFQKLRRSIRESLTDEHPLTTAERVELADMLAGDER